MAVPSRLEAFTLLGLQDPIVVQRLHKVLGVDPTWAGIGTTTTMLVEAALDSLKGHTVDLVFHKAQDARGAQQQCEAMAETLCGPVGPYGAIHGLVWAQFGDPHRDLSERVYRDHRWSSTEDRRLRGPFGEIRVIRKVGPDHYQAFDYDGLRLMDLDEAQAKRLSGYKPYRIWLDLVGSPTPPAGWVPAAWRPPTRCPSGLVGLTRRSTACRPE